jgi:predicted nucleic acid-binding protein
MNLVDSCGWLEYIADGRNADFFAPALESEDELIAPSICVAEVFERLLIERGEDEAIRALAAMQRCLVVDLDERVAVLAARLGVDHGLPLADSVVLATARLHDAVVWTQDSDFEGLEGVRYVRRKRRKR